MYRTAIYRATRMVHTHRSNSLLALNYFITNCHTRERNLRDIFPFVIFLRNARQHLVSLFYFTILLLFPFLSDRRQPCFFSLLHEV